MGDRRADAAPLTSPRRRWPLVVRRARPDDEQAVRAFATHTWGDWDYVPHAFGRWIDAPDGVLLVGTPGPNADGSAALDADGEPLLPDRPVAFVRVALVARGEAWLEAIRVDPRVRGMDVATDLQVAELRWAMAQDTTVIRYATGSDNEGSHRLGRRGGFELLATMDSHWWSPTGDPEADEHEEEGLPSGFLAEMEAAVEVRRDRLLHLLAEGGLVARSTGAEDLWRRISGDATFIAGERLYELRPWALEELSETKFRTHLEAGEVIEHVADGQWAAAVFVRRTGPAEDIALRFAVLCGGNRPALSLAEAARELAGELIRFRTASGAPLVHDAVDAWRAAGYVSPDWQLHLLRRQLDARHPLPPIEPARLVLADEPVSLLQPAH